MDEQQLHEQQDSGRRALHLLLAAVVAAAIIGYFIGIDYGVPRPDYNAAPTQPPEVDQQQRQVIPATAYAELPTTDIGPNRNWSSDLKKLKWNAPEVPDILRYAADPVAKAAAVEHRAERRAYNGAPPVVPHAVNQLSSENCLSCHGEGLKVAERTARLMPHPYLTNCLQCHVQQKSTQFQPTVLAENTFQGKGAPVGGPRAWPGAPPQIPHTTYMRDKCVACHGPLGLDGMRTSHPWRRNCVQCHTPSAEIDQKFFSDTPSFLPPPQVRGDETESSTPPAP